MKNSTLVRLLFVFLLTSSFITFAQSDRKKTKSDAIKDNSELMFGQELTEANQKSLQETGFIRCASTEYETYLQSKYNKRSSNDEFENWMNSELVKYKQNPSAYKSQAVLTLPVVFHVITDGAGAENIAATYIQAQVDQLNIDYRNLAGSSYAVADDSEIEFCLAQQDPSGSPMAENGINRVTTYGDGPFGIADFENTIKPGTQWDPERYMNIWVADLSSPLLGYAQFPQLSTAVLPGNPYAGEPANTDGVVVLYSSVGSVATPYPGGAPYNLGRTLTHEVGHWLGLRHIWGDPNTGVNGCTVDDYCTDTPNAAASNGGCPNNTSCGTLDMVENYMDYTNDSCMDTFTADQNARIDIVMANAPRRVNLATSNVCSPAAPTITFGSTSPGTVPEGSGCNYQDFVIDLTLSEAASANATVTLVNSGTATENDDFMLMNNTVTFPAGSTTPSNAVTLRIFEDGIVEADETISLAINVSTSGDATATTATYDATITNDDVTVTDSYTITHFSDDFNDEDVSDWSITDSDGDGRAWADYFQVGTPPLTPISLISRSWEGSALTPDNWIVTPAIDLSSVSGTITLEFITQVAAASWDQEYLTIYAGITNNITTLGATTPIFNQTLGDAGDTGTPVNQTADISSLAGQPAVYIAFRHWNCTDQDFLSVDDVMVTSSATTEVQTMTNSSAPDSYAITGSGMSFGTDPTSGDLMTSIDNTAGFNYGCTDIAVSRDQPTVGSYATMYSSAVVAEYVTAKTFDISTANASLSDASTIDFYFTEAEIAGWETETGNTRNDLFIKNDTTGEVVSAAISTFGSDVKVTGNFSMGLAGTYYFGIMASFSVEDLQLQNSISIYPNPVVNNLHIKVLNGNQMPETYTVYNMLGQVITRKVISTDADLTVNTTALSNGMYFIRISKGNSNTTLPFIKK